MREDGFLTAPTYDISNKTACYLAALQNIGITQNNIEDIIEFETAPCPPDNFHWNWGKYPGNTRFDPKPEITIKLQKLYMRGKGGGGKNIRITAEKAYDILNETVIQYDWEQQMILSVPRINHSSLRPQKNGRYSITNGYWWYQIGRRHCRWLFFTRYLTSNSNNII